MVKVEVELMDVVEYNDNYNDEDDFKKEQEKRCSFKRYDKSKVHYYNCKKFGHFISKYWYDDFNQVKEKANWVVKKNEEEEPFLFIVDIEDEFSKQDVWFLNTDTSKPWFRSLRRWILGSCLTFLGHKSKKSKKASSSLKMIMQRRFAKVSKWKITSCLVHQ